MRESGISVSRMLAYLSLSLELQLEEVTRALKTRLAERNVLNYDVILDRFNFAEYL
jgi:hypothetical protein